MSPTTPPRPAIFPVGSTFALPAGRPRWVRRSGALMREGAPSGDGSGRMAPTEEDVMRKVIYSMTVSLDGFIADPNGEIDWSAPDEELHRFHNERVRELGAHLLGRRLYQEMLYWETAHEDPTA